MRYALTAGFALMLNTMSHAEPIALDPTIATLGGDVITASEVMAHVRPVGIRLGSDPLPDPRQVALDDALRVRLFAAAARELGLEPPNGPLSVQMAFLNQAFIKQVSIERQLSADSVSDEIARDYFKTHQDRLLKLSEVSVQAIVVDDAELAEELLEKAARSSSEEFSELAMKFSQHDSSLDGGLLGTFNHDHSGFDGSFDDAVVRAAYRLTKPGMVAFVPVNDSSFYILRGDSPQFTSRQWDDEFALYMRNAVVYEQKREHLDQIFARLRAEADISVDSNALSNISTD